MKKKILVIFTVFSLLIGCALALNAVEGKKVTLRDVGLDSSEKDQFLLRTKGVLKACARTSQIYNRILTEKDLKIKNLRTIQEHVVKAGNFERKLLKSIKNLSTVREQSGKFEFSPDLNELTSKLAKMWLEFPSYGEENIDWKAAMPYVERDINRFAETIKSYEKDYGNTIDSFGTL